MGDAQCRVAQPAQRAFGLEAIGDLDRAAHCQHRAHVGSQADDMKHRRLAQKTAVRFHPCGDAEVVRDLLQVLFAQHHALGLAGRAGGEQDQADPIGRNVGCFGRCKLLGVVDEAGEVFHLRASGSDIVAQQQARLCTLQQGIQLSATQPPVERYVDCTNPRTGKMQRNLPDRIARQHRKPFAVDTAACLQHGSQATDQVVQFGVGPFLLQQQVAGSKPLRCQAGMERYRVGRHGQGAVFRYG